MPFNCRVRRILLSIAIFCSKLHVTAGAPTFTVRPQSVTVTEGETVRLSCAATGTPTPVLTWAFGSRQLQPQSDGTLVIQAVTKSDEGDYECAASNVDGHIETSATVTVNDRYKPYFTSVPQNTTAAEGSTVNLPCTAIGRPTPSISWSKINGPLPAGYIIQPEYLMLPNVNKLASGMFQCTSVNTHGSISVTATLLILDPIIFERTPRNHNGVIGGTALLECSIDPNGTPATISWLKDDIRIDSSTMSRYSIISGGSLLISGLQREDMARYTCKAEGVVGVLTASAIILLPGAKQPEFNTIPTSAPILPGDTIKLDCAANGVPDPQVTWTKDGQSLAAVVDARYTVVGTRLVILSANSQDSGNFTCTATNIVGTATKWVYLRVGAPAPTTAAAMVTSIRVTDNTAKDSDLIFIVALAVGITGGVIVIIIIIIICCCCCSCCQRKDADIEKVLESKTSFPSWQNGGAVDLGKVPPSSFTNPSYVDGFQTHDPTNQILQQRLHRMGMEMPNSDKFQQALAPDWAASPNNDEDEQSEETESETDDSEESETDDSEESETEETETGPDTRHHLKGSRTTPSKQSRSVEADRESNKHRDDHRRSTEYRRGSNQYQEDRRGSTEYRDDRRSSVTRQDGRRGSVQRREDPRHSYEQRDERRASQEFRGDRRGSFQRQDGRRGSAQYQDGRRGSAQYQDGRRGSAQYQDGRRGSAQYHSPPHGDRRYDDSYAERRLSKQGSKSPNRRFSSGDVQPVPLARRDSQVQERRRQSRRASVDNPQAAIRKSRDHGRRLSAEHERKRSGDYERGGERRSSRQRLSYDEGNDRDNGGRRQSRSSATDRRQRDYEDQMLF